ncbi:MAG: hypothetical protein ACI4J0_09840 [Huintestinicola sp.]|uniref:hypothetical protein n=1 Tax=Huintestinicola sp. TaxID=2981661 RepID=UPI003F070DF7
MASRIMHLAMGIELCRVCEINDRDRFLVGMLLPDTVITGDKKTAGTHYDRMTDELHKVMDFSLFYSEFEEKIHTDELYLGYYLHLIEDCIFRKYIYYGLGLLEMRGREGFLPRLYKDYHSVNGYIVKKYNISSLPIAPEGLDREEINRIYPFETRDFLIDMEKDMQDEYLGNEKYFSAENADEVIRQCIHTCSAEILALKRGEHFTSPDEYIWEARG